MVSLNFQGTHLQECHFALFGNACCCFSCGQFAYRGMQKRQGLYAKWQVSFLHQPAPPGAISLCFIVLFYVFLAGSRHSGAYKNDRFCKRNGMPARPDRSICRVADSPKSQGFISEMKVLPPGWPTSPESKFARFYKRNEPVDVSARIANPLCFTSAMNSSQRKH